MPPALLLRNFIGALLRADPDVVAIVGKKVRDDVPSDDKADLLPWFAMGPITMRRMQTGGDPSWWVTQRVFAESSEFDRDQAWILAEAGIRAIEGRRGPEEQGFLDYLEVGAAADVIDPGKIKTVSFDVTALMTRID